LFLKQREVPQVHVSVIVDICAASVLRIAATGRIRAVQATDEYSVILKIHVAVAVEVDGDHGCIE